MLDHVEHAVGIDRDGVDAGVDEKLRKARVIARCLAA
jgi:hypothetical protein